jgi:hypothetical protein
MEQVVAAENKYTAAAAAASNKNLIWIWLKC